jgi:hypothetical protein
VETLNGDAADATLGTVLKDHEDLEVARSSLARVLDSGE